MEKLKNNMPGVKPHQGHDAITSLDWQSISRSLHQRGYIADTPVPWGGIGPGPGKLI